ncbi:MAG: TPM domain-containing protein [Flavobacteriaceae bacterium]|nr:TPM domain-containing protein [Flavobacteriaceae bacterium]
MPEKQTSLYDYANLLSAVQQNSLEEKLIRYADSTSTQIVIAIIKSSNGEDLSMLGARWGQKWGVGQAEEDNGIFILLATEDRRVDINTGYGIEYRISDRDAERIINRVMIPQFKKGDYYSGLDQGADAIFASLNGEFQEDRDFSRNSSDGGGSIFFLILLFIFIIIILRSRNKGGGGKSGGRRKGASLLDVIILSSMGRTGGFGTGGGFGSGGGGSFGGGGGFGGGFGGGGFGGGGASGGW